MSPSPDLDVLHGDPLAQRRLIDDLIRVALNAADPREAVFRRVQRIGHVLTVAGEAIDLRAIERVFLVSIGKAAAPMADALIDLLDERLTAGVLITGYGQTASFQAPPQLRVVESGHPIPDHNSIAGARAIERLLRDATERDLLLCAISGGGSALATLPVDGVALSALQTTTDLLLRSGATIHQLNTVRKHLDRLKGGGLVRLSHGARILTFLLSDVIGDDLSIIASGPTVPDPSTFAEAWEVCERFGLTDRLPAPVSAHIAAGVRGDRPDTLKPGDPRFERVLNVVIGSNRVAAEAVERYARTLGLHTLLLSTFIQGEAREAGKVAAAIAREIDAHGRPIARPACLLWGGETTVTVRGSGRGGRNQELALAAAFGIAGLADTWVVALATDGTDGPTDAAGAIVTGHTLARAKEKNLSAEKDLADNNSHGFFTELEAVGSLAGLIKTGPTGTNVNDLLYLLLF